MVKHIILWKLRSELSAEEKRAAAQAIKQGLEALKGQVPPNTELRTCLDFEC